MNRIDMKNFIFMKDEERENIENKTWEKEDGSKIAVEDMSIDHMFNCVKMLKGGLWHLRFIWIEIFIKELDKRFEEFEDEMLK